MITTMNLITWTLAGISGGLCAAYIRPLWVGFIMCILSAMVIGYAGIGLQVMTAVAE